MSKFQLFREIIALSNATNWESAVLEWVVGDIWEEEEAGTCLCGHFPIKDHCQILNIRNNESAIVGNCCVKKFMGEMGVKTERAFSALKRVRKDNTKSLNLEALDILYDNKIITEWEHLYYNSIKRKRSLTYKQSKVKIRINEKAALYLAGSRPKGHRRFYVP